MPQIYCAKCDMIRDDSTAPCECGCVSWSRLPRVEVGKLIEDNIALVHWVVGKWITPVLAPSVLNRIGLGEIVAVGEEKLLDLARRFDAARGAKFSTFAARYLRHWLWRHINRETRRYEKEGFFPQYDDGNQFDPADFRPDLTIEFEVRDEAESKLPGLFSGLTKNEKVAVELIKSRGFRLREAGDILGVTRERARQLAAAGLAKMKAAAAGG